MDAAINDVHRPAMLLTAVVMLWLIPVVYAVVSALLWELVYKQ